MRHRLAMPTLLFHVRKVHAPELTVLPPHHNVPNGLVQLLIIIHTTHFPLKREIELLLNYERVLRLSL